MNLGCIEREYNERMTMYQNQERERSQAVTSLSPSTVPKAVVSPPRSTPSSTPASPTSADDKAKCTIM
jgi:hypothetical protein